MTRGLRTTAVALIVAAASLLPGPSQARDTTAPAPLVWQTDVADPAVVRSNSGWVALATGAYIPGFVSPSGTGPFTSLGPTLTSAPPWMLPGGIWAPDVFRTTVGWVLYYSARAAGVARSGRCIGVAIGPAATGPFTPAGDVPLVCPPRVGWPSAEDELADKEHFLPAGGVIDPSVFQEKDGRLFLLYKTQSKPSTIRMLPLSRDGLHAAYPSRKIAHSRDTIENPVMVRRGRTWTLFTSERSYVGCDYVTTWRQSSSKWSFPGPGSVLFDHSRTGICGPGGGDLVPAGKKRVRMYLHGWVCYRSDVPCPTDFRSRVDPDLFPIRGLYAATLRFDTRGRPRFVDWVSPR
ncbi:MAG: family 43 glycosylhydrolase [Nocardioides sp.]|jgi:arabinan endo-1,5-alpha-L-arabinosidase